MIDREPADPALAILSLSIGIIMEDHVEEAITRLPGEEAGRRERFARLASAGRDIAALAAAAEVLTRRGTG